MKKNVLLFITIMFFIFSAHSQEYTDVVCGDVNTVSLGADFFGDIDFYHCEGAEFEAYGPETIFKILIGDNTEISAAITELDILGPEEEARLYVHIFVFDEDPLFPDSNPIACTDGTVSAITECLPEGEYYIVVDFSSNNYPGDYDIEINCTECNTIIDVECGDINTVNLGADFFGDIDYYYCEGAEFEAYGPETIFKILIEDYTEISAAITELDVLGSEEEARLYVHIFIFDDEPLSPDSNLIDCTDGTAPTITECLPEGEYYIVVDFSSDNYPGDYDIEINCEGCNPLNVKTEDILDIDNIKTFPNPANEILNIQFPENTVSGEFAILDITGRNIYNGKINSVNMQIDISNMKSGWYIIKTFADNKEYYSRFSIVK